jgi:hypothetical protein
MQTTKPLPDRVLVLPSGHPEVGAGNDHIALVLALAECTPDGRFQAQELRARLHLTVGKPGPVNPDWSPAA